jgi:hypothetical protein
VDTRAAEREAIEDDWFRGSAAAVRTRTGPDGSYVLEGIADASYLLGAWKRGHRISPVDRWQTSAHPGSTVDFLAWPIVAVPIEVRRETGDPEPYAAIEAKRGSDTLLWIWTPDSPSVPLRPGTWTLRAVDRRTHDRTRVRRQSGPVEVAVSADRPPKAVVLTMGIRPGIRGRVLGRPPFAHPRVVVSPLPEGVSPERYLMCLSRMGPSRFLFDQDEFAIHDLEPGRWIVVLYEGYDAPVIDHEVVTVGAGMTEVDLEYPDIPPADAFLVRILDEAGRPERDVEMSLGRRRSRPLPDRRVDARLTDRGVWKVRRPASDEPADGGFWYLALESPRFGLGWVEVDPGAEGIQEFRIGPPARLDVKMVGAVMPPGDPGSWTAELRPLLRGHYLRSVRGCRIERTHPDGRGTFGPVAPGTYELTVTRPGGEPVTERILLEPGPNSLVLPAR